MALNAKLHIEAALSGDKTILKKTFYTPPFKIADVTEDKRQSKLQLMMMSSSPGVLDCDEYKIQIDLAEGCSLELKTQAYQRLYQMKKGATQIMTVNMKKDSSLTYIPHPLVPHENSNFLSKNKIFMEEDCSLIWGEVLSCGRKVKGEVFKFSSYHNITEVFINNKLVVKENILMRPVVIDVNAIGQLEVYTHQASLFCIGNRIGIEGKIEIINELLLNEKDIEYGISCLPVNGLVVRLLGYRSEQLFDLLTNISDILSKEKFEERIYVA
jgi:urease accessory protein